jgi:(p)ppGpp synthase/HD superfamily hydrolase
LFNNDDILIDKEEGFCCCAKAAGILNDMITVLLQANANINNVSTDDDDDVDDMTEANLKVEILLLVISKCIIKLLITKHI